MKERLLQIDNVCLSYGERHVLCHISADVGSEDFIVLVGPNGGGKTTLLRLMAGLLPPTCGSISRRKDMVVGYLPQYRRIDRQFPTTVADIVLSGLACRKRMWQAFSNQHRAEAAKAIDFFHLTDLAHSPIANLSGGQWQRALIARAVVSRPDLLLLDEPETHLDNASRNELYAMLSRWNSRCAIVVVSHEQQSFPSIPYHRLWLVENQTLTEKIL